MYDDLQNEASGSSETKPFLASEGWFERFKRRHDLHNITMGGEAANADTETAHKYPEELKYTISEGGYTPQKVLYVDKTGLFLKYISARTFISTKEKLAPGLKPPKIIYCCFWKAIQQVILR